VIAGFDAAPPTTDYGAGALLVAIALYVLSVGDRFVLASTRPLEEVGTYAAAYGMVDLALRFTPSVLFVALRPRLFQAWDAGHREVALRWAIDGSVALALALVPVGWVLVAAVPVVIGEPEAGQLVGPIALGLVLFVVANTLGLLYATGLRQIRLGVHLALAAGANIGLNVLLTPALGPLASAALTAVSYAILLALNLWGLRRVAPGSEPMLLPLALTLVASAAVAATGAGPSWPLGLAGGLACIGAACGLAWLALRRRSRTAEERELAGR
jgi:O-antigen/teichoic acid export membrane protein